MARQDAGMEQPPTRLQVWSTPAILFLHRLPRWVFPVATAALLLFGLLAPVGWLGGTALLAVGLVLGWLLALSWQLLAWPARGTRLLLVLLIAGYASGRFAGSV